MTQSIALLGRSVAFSFAVSVLMGPTAAFADEGSDEVYARIDNLKYEEEQLLLERAALAQENFFLEAALVYLADNAVYAEQLSYLVQIADEAVDELQDAFSEVTQGHLDWLETVNATALQLGPAWSGIDDVATYAERVDQIQQFRDAIPYLEQSQADAAFYNSAFVANTACSFARKILMKIVTGGTIKALSAKTDTTEIIADLRELDERLLAHRERITEMQKDVLGLSGKRRDLLDALEVAWRHLLEAGLHEHNLEQGLEFIEFLEQIERGVALQTRLGQDTVMKYMSVSDILTYQLSPLSARRAAYVLRQELRDIDLNLPTFNTTAFYHDLLRELLDSRISAVDWLVDSTTFEANTDSRVLYSDERNRLLDLWTAQTPPDERCSRIATIAREAEDEIDRERAFGSYRRACDHPSN